MLKIEVNGKTVEADQGETILQALTRHGIKVPTLCHLPGLAPSGACRRRQRPDTPWRHMQASARWLVSAQPTFRPFAEARAAKTACR